MSGRSECLAGLRGGFKDYSNRPMAKVCHFYSENGLEVAFVTTPKKRNPKMPSCGFLKIIPIGILSYARRENQFLGLTAWKPVFRADISVEIGFHAGVGQNANWNNV